MYFSTVNWRWIKQRPHFISFYLSKQGHEVDYISLNPFGKTRIQKFRMDKLNVKDTYVLPFSLKIRAIERINVAYIRSLFSTRRYDLVVLTSPLHYQYIPSSIGRDSTLIYECMDNMPYFYENRLRERLFLEEQKLLELADAIITSSDHLSQELQQRSPCRPLNIRTIHNALDKQAFCRRPRKIALQEPNMVYLGTIGPWLDWDTLEKFAARHPRFTLYFIGPMERQRKLLPNMVWLGSVSHEEVVDYIYSGNVMLLPFKINELTKAVDPVKMYEYLSMDKPVISAYWPELDKFRSDKLKFYTNYQQFEKFAFQAAVNDSHNELNTAFINQHNWENRVREYLEFISELRGK